MIRRILPTILLWTAAAFPAEISVRNFASQSAVWPGDHFQYSIIMTVPAGSKVALEDFDPKRINFKPFTLMDAKSETDDLGGGMLRHEFEYLLANYEIGDKRLAIPAVTFRYQEDSSALANDSGIREMRIPPVAVSVHSTLTQHNEQEPIRDYLPRHIGERHPWIPITAGIIGLLASVFPLFAWSAITISKRMTRSPQFNRKEFLRSCVADLDSLDRNGGGIDVKDSYGKLEVIALNYIRNIWSVQGAGLTHEELASRLQLINSNHEAREVLCRLFEHSRNCRYSPDSGVEWQALLRQDTASMKKLCGL